MKGQPTQITDPNVLKSAIGLRASKGGAVAVTEGLAVREALRFPCRRCGIDAVELDEKTLPGVAAEKLRISTAEVDAHLKMLGVTAGKPWRKEQKLACLAAWVAIAGAR